MLRARPGGLHCGNCPFKDSVALAGERWGPRHERQFCHGGNRPMHHCGPAEQDGEKDCCAYLWPTWDAIDYFYETTALIDLGMAPPKNWQRRHWRLASRIKAVIQEIELSEREH